ncbi:MAG: outer membrane protein assembly factor BamA [bacterium]|nr:outer membrane protein assembly factor BamA [bacterium]
MKITSENQVASLVVQGNTRIHKKNILREVKTKPGVLYLQSAVEEDLRRIYALGYFADVTLDVAKEPTGVKVTFVVKENPVIVDLVFEGNKSFRAKRLKEEIGFKKEMVMQSDTLAQFADKLKTWYETKKFTVEVKGNYEPITADSGKLHYSITEQKKQKIVFLSIQGNKALKSKPLIKKLKSKKSGFIAKHYYDQSDIADDRMIIESLYKEQGYLKAKVTVLDPEPVPKKHAPRYEGKGVGLRFAVEEGAQYRWNKVEVAGNTLFATDELRGSIRASTGKTYQQSVLEADMVRLYEPYANQGYIQNEVKPQITSNDTDHTVNVLYQIRENPRIYLGQVNVQGINFTEDKNIQEVPLKTKKKVVLREVTLHPGDVFSRKEVLKTQQKLYNLGYFDQVGMAPESTVAEDTMDLFISLIEKKTGNVTFGGGYSSEKKAALFLDLVEPNLLGTGRYIRLRTEIAEAGTDYSVTYREPYFLDTPLTVELSIFRESLERSLRTTPFDYDATGNRVYSDSSTHDYQERQTGGAISVSYPVTSNLRWTARLKHVRVKLEPEEDDYHIPSIVGPAESVTQSITPGLIYDSRDNYFWATRGSRYVANIEFAGGPFGGDNDYLKYSAEGSWYKRLGAQFISALRLRGRYISPFNDTEDAPLPERFFLGGSNTLRGYDFRGVSPHLVYIDEAQKEIVEVTVGGDIMLNANLELRRPIVDRVYGILFLDAGGVWQKAEDIDLSTIRYGAGPGILLNLPIGYIQLGYGFGFNAQPGDEKQGFYFTFGTTF